MMHVAYSKFDEPVQSVKKPQREQSDFARQMAYKLYKKACKDNAERIAKVQQHFPGWYPKFNYRG